LQVRKVIWELFQLCPTPAAAASADTQAIQSLIQPLGLFRKRAVAVQQLSRDYLHKQVGTGGGRRLNKLTVAFSRSCSL
jgi:endonuclease III